MFEADSAAATTGPAARACLLAGSAFGLLDGIVQLLTPDALNDAAYTRRLYLRRHALIDVLANVPLWLAAPSWRWLTTNHVLRGLRLFRTATAGRAEALASLGASLHLNPSVLRLLLVVLVLLVYWHWVACGYYAVKDADARISGVSSSNSSSPSGGAGGHTNVMEMSTLADVGARYALAYYWAVSTAIGSATPEGFPSYSTREQLFATVVIVTGFALNLVSVGIVNSIMA